jgi:hypothetical protein
MQKSLVITGAVLSFLVLGSISLISGQSAPPRDQGGQMAAFAEPAPAAVAGFDGMAWMDGETTSLPLHRLKAGAEGQLIFHLRLPSGYKLNPAAPVSYEVRISGAGIQMPDSGRPHTAHIIEVPLSIPFRTLPGTHRATLDVEATFYWCRDDNTGLCIIQAARWHIPIETVEAEGQQHITLSTTAHLQDVGEASLSPSAPLGYKQPGRP